MIPVIPDPAVDKVHKLLSLLTWRRIGCILILCIFGATIIYGIVEKDTKGSLGVISKKYPVLLLSDNVRKSITLTMNKRSDLIIGVQVVTVDFKKNLLLDTFAVFNNPVAQLAYDAFTYTVKYYEAPLFNGIPRNDNRILKIITGEFIITPFKGGIADKYAPAASAVITDIANIAIPPYNNDIVGILVTYLSHSPDKQELEELHQFTRETSMQIYNENPNFHAK